MCKLIIVSGYIGGAIVAASRLKLKRSRPLQIGVALIMQSSSLESRRLAVTAAMNRICKQYDEDESAQLLDLMIEGQTVLRDNGLASDARVHSLKTVIHPRNRHEGMLDVSSVPELVADISDVAFSLNEVAQAAAVRMPPQGSAQRKAIETKNEELVATSGAQLAPVVRDDAEIMVVGCCHNSAGLKAINAQGKCTIERISENGRYSAAKIISRCPSYKQSIEDGLKYCIYEYVVEEYWPSFVDLTIEACNIGSSLAKADNVLQLMRKACKLARQPGSDSAQIVRKMSRSKPALIELLPQAVKYVELWSGGSPPKFLDSVIEFSRTLQKPLYANITTPLLQKLNEVDMGAGKGARHRAAVLKGCLVYDKFIMLPHLAALHRVGNARTLALKAEEMGLQFEQAAARLVKNNRMHQAALTSALGAFEIDMVAYAHGLSKKHKTMDDAAALHFSAFLRAVDSTAKNPFMQEQAPKAAAKSKAPASGSVQQLGALGFSNQQLFKKAVEMGFSVGGHILDGKKNDFTIVELDEDSDVTVSPKSDKRRKITVTLQQLVDEYKLAQRADMVIIMYSYGRRKCNRTRRKANICCAARVYAFGGTV